MNITLVSLISSSLYSHSPAFAGYDISISKCNFHKFSSIIFYNQKYLNVADSIFSKCLNGVATLNGEPVINGNQLTYSETFKSFDHSYISSGKKAVTFINCLFDSIGSSDKSDILRISNQQLSVYITRSSFINCNSKDGVLYLELCRCVTITHVCSLNSKAGSNSAFLNMNCKSEDFFIFLFSTITTSDGHDIGCDYNVRCRSGDQYFRCINMTKSNRGGFQFDASRCFSFGMTNIKYCSGRTIELSGRNPDKNYLMENTNIICNTGTKLIRLASDNPFSCTFSQSTIINEGGGIIEKGGNGANINLYLNDCLYLTKSNDDYFITQGSISVSSFSSEYLKPLHLYTDEKYCPGIANYDEEIAHGCNAENCLDSACGEKIEFPDDAVTYKTFIDTNIQTPGPTDFFSPSDKFTQSRTFTPSSAFSFSKSFTESNKFSESDKFSQSNKFSQSKSFSQSDKFTTSNAFTLSNKFTFSNKFSSSSKFSKSEAFSGSANFSSSIYFTGSNMFSFTANFTKSEMFTISHNFSESNYFSQSNDFTKSKIFSETTEFTKSGLFSETADFTKSAIFSASFNFTKSEVFSPSNNFNATHTFTPSNFFSPSSNFTKSFVFSSSTNFTYSAQFTESSKFSSSTSFSGSSEFTKTDHFTESTKFTASNDFTLSKDFTNSKKFTQSDHFTPSNNFDATHTFTASNTFTPSDAFSNSNYFSQSMFFTSSNKFTKSGSFSESNKFSESSTFSESQSFSKSNSFSASKTFLPRKSVVIAINSEQKGKNKWKTIGGAVGAVAGVLAILLSIVAFIIIRHRKLRRSSGIFEEFDTIEDPATTSVTYNNSLRSFDMSDDPFADDFADHN